MTFPSLARADNKIDKTFGSTIVQKWPQINSKLDEKGKSTVLITAHSSLAANIL